MGKQLCTWLLTIFLPTSAVLADLQQQAKIPRIGYLTGTREPTRDAPDANRDAFRQGLRDLGYIEGKNILIEYRYAAGKMDRLPAFVTELMQLKVDVIVGVPFPAILSAKQATKSIPIVMVINQDPVATGMINSLARPGGNITGVTRLTRELSGKRLELLKELNPAISRFGVLWDVSNNVTPPGPKEYEVAARDLKMQLKSLEVRSPKPDLEGVFQAAVEERTNALIIVRNALLIDNRKRIAQLAIQNRLPAISEGTVFVEAGVLASYSSDENDSFRRASIYVDKILKGAKPAELPVEQPTKFELVINLTTAKQIGLTIPPIVLARADKVIK